MPESPAGDRAVEPLADERVVVPVSASELVFEGHVWDIRRETFDLGDGPIVRDFMDHPGAVAVLALDDEDRAFLIRQYRHPVGLRDWEIPAGLLDVAGEDPLEGAKRELAEEGDLEASEWSVLADFLTTPGGSNEALRIYLARGIRPSDEVFEREDEEAHIETRWVPLDECVDAVLARQVQNPSLVIAVLAAQASRSRGWRSLGEADAPWPTRSPGRGTSAEAAAAEDAARR
ncbi:NUDIX domain-containing protein [Agromyces aureus]|uniref:ADP-ribose pyrophosphatase n=1 Tax=Agromyces aureus TaxID=453304 RepID=A0A191WGG6_9MICO|nr:NUDIX hydrolase [Agromyces aureus]ANJ27390.1 ADP-ribose pyrophosphatase [Agromyces aureus]